MNIRDLKVGDMFLDADHCLCIFLGYEKEAVQIDDVGAVVIDGHGYRVIKSKMRPQVTYICFYKNTWVHCDAFELETIYPLNDKARALAERLTGGFVDNHNYDCEEYDR